MKKTHLYNSHLKHGGRMVDFAGWELPVMYSSIIEEHMATRKAAGLFDISHMGEIIVKGKNAEDFLRSLIPTSMDKLYNGKSMYSCFCNINGGIIDDLFIFMISPNEFYLVVNASTLEKDLNWLNQNLISGVEVIDVSDTTSKIDIQGPESLNIMKAIFNDEMNDLKRFHFKFINYKESQILVSQTGYTGELGFELFINNDKAENMWNEFIKAGEPFGIKPVGLGARDTLRLEASYSLYGHELTEEYTPVESGISWIINSTDSYKGKDVIVKQKESGTENKLIALELTEKGVPREQYIVEKNSVNIGIITSGAYSPFLKKGIALARIKKGTVSIGDDLDIIIRGKKIKAIAVKKPFYNYRGNAN